VFVTGKPRIFYEVGAIFVNIRQTISFTSITAPIFCKARLRWMADVVTDLRAMKIRQWTEKADDREQRTGCQGGQGSPRAVAPGGWMDIL
jgi:hypothetical protein